MFIVAFIILIIDQVTKFFALNLRDGKVIYLIDEFLKFKYLENRGAAFGILQNQKWLLSLVSIAVIIYLIYFYFKYKNRLSSIYRVTLGLILGGAIGNLIDRMVRNFVVDFISVTFPNGYNFPIFNVADMAIVIGVILILILTIKEGDVLDG